MNKKLFLVFVILMLFGSVEVVSAQEIAWEDFINGIKAAFNTSYVVTSYTTSYQVSPSQSFNIQFVTHGFYGSSYYTVKHRVEIWRIDNNQLIYSKEESIANGADITWSIPVTAPSIVGTYNYKLKDYECIGAIGSSDCKYGSAVENYFNVKVVSLETPTPIPTPTPVPTVYIPQPQTTPPSTTVLDFVKYMWSYILSFFGNYLAVTGNTNFIVGSGVQTFTINTQTTEIQDINYNDGTYNEFWGTWSIVDSNQNIITQKGNWVRLNSGTYSDTATYTFEGVGKYVVVGMIVKVPYSYVGSTWSRGVETVIAKDVLSVRVDMAAPPSSAPTTPVSSFIASFFAWIKSLLGWL